MGLKFSEIPNGSSVTGTTYFIAAVYAGGVWSNAGQKFTAQQIQDAVIVTMRKNITALTANISTVTVANDTLTDAFFADDITSILTNSQAYIVGVDFTQNTGDSTITLINGSNFNNNQVLIAMK
jgi:hypothetical protein